MAVGGTAEGISWGEGNRLCRSVRTSLSNLDLTKEFTIMHYDGLVILLVVFVGLVPICRGSKWNWKVVHRSKALSAVFWFGWFTAIVVGLLRLLGVG